MVPTFTNLKTGRQYVLMTYGQDATNRRDGELVAIYAKKGVMSFLASLLFRYIPGPTVFVREAFEFDMKFKMEG